MKACINFYHCQISFIILSLEKIWYSSFFSAPFIDFLLCRSFKENPTAEDLAQQHKQPPGKCELGPEFDSLVPKDKQINKQNTTWGLVTHMREKEYISITFCGCFYFLGVWKQKEKLLIKQYNNQQVSIS